MQLNALSRGELRSSLTTAEEVSGESKDSERMQPCYSQRGVRLPAVSAMLRTNQKPSYAIIREWLIAGVALRTDCRQRQLWDSLKNLKFKLHWIGSRVTGGQAYG